MSGRTDTPARRPLAAQVITALSDNEFRDFKAKTVVRSIQDSRTGQSVATTVAQYPLLRGVPRGTQGYIHPGAPPRLQQPGWVVFEPLKEDKYGSLVQAFPGAPNWGMVQLPAKNLATGHEKRDKLTTRGLENPFPTPRLFGEPVAPLENLFNTLIVTLLEQPAVKEFAGISLRLYAEKYRKELVNAVMTGFGVIYPKMNPFASRLPTMSEIWKNAVPYKQNKAKWQSEAEVKTVVIYVIIYRWLDENGQECFKDYWGKTVNLYMRHANHRDAIEVESTDIEGSNHYTEARKLVRKPGGTWDLFPIMAIRKPTVSNADDIMRSVHPWAEQLMIALAKSYNGRLLNMPNTIAATAQLWSVKLAGEIINTVNAICGQPHFQAFGRQNPSGLNWGSPIMANTTIESSLWVGTELSHRYTFKRQSLKVHRTVTRFKTKAKGDAAPVEKTSESLWIRMGPHSRGQPGKRLHITIRKEWGLKKADRVVANIEIMKDDHAIHPHAYALMPTIGPFDQWHHGNRVAIRLEWLRHGRVQTVYAYAVYSLRFYTKKDLRDADYDGDYEITRHMPATWSLSMQLLTTLLGWEWDYQGPPSQVLNTRRIDPWPARVKMIKFDFRDQVMQVTSQQKIKVPAPRLLTMDQTAQLLLDKYGKDLVIGVPDENLFKGDWGTSGRRNATACDLCDFLTVDDRSSQDKDYVHKFRPSGTRLRTCVTKKIGQTQGGETLHSCNTCELLRRYCTFSSRYKLWGNLEKYKTLSFYERPKNPVVEIPPGAQGVDELVFDGAVDDLSDDDDDEEEAETDTIQIQEDQE